MLQSSQTTRKELRQFGLLFGVIFTGIGLYQLYNDTAETARLVWWILGVLFFIAGFAAPTALKPIHTIWMKFAFVLGWVNTRIIITLIFFLVVTPIGLIMRAAGKDPMNRKPDPQANTYWIEHEQITDQSRYFRQF